MTPRRSNGLASDRRPLNVADGSSSSVRRHGRRHRASRTSQSFGLEPVLLVGAICYHAATRTPGTRRIQEDIQLERVAYFAYA